MKVNRCKFGIEEKKLINLLCHDFNKDICVKSEKKLFGIKERQKKNEERKQSIKESWKRKEDREITKPSLLSCNCTMACLSETLMATMQIPIPTLMLVISS